MQVFLKEDVEHLGHAGEIVDVKPGYARNYLIPQNKGMTVTRKNEKSIHREIERFRKDEVARLENLKTEAEKLEAVSCTVASNADDNDKLYGSVTQAEIAKALAVQGFVINPKQIHIEEAIKKIGVHEVEVVLDREVTAKIKVWVVRDN